jgi:hypothetical protein
MGATVGDAHALIGLGHFTSDHAAGETSADYQGTTGRQGDSIAKWANTINLILNYRLVDRAVCLT